MTFVVTLTAAARDDLSNVADWIADRAGDDVAFRYIDRIETAVKKLADYPRRGSPRPGLVPEARSITFERRLLIIYAIEGDAVSILRVIDAPRDLHAVSLD